MAIWSDVRHHLAGINKSVLVEQIERNRAHIPGRRAIAFSFAADSAQQLEGLDELRLFLCRRQTLRWRVRVTVDRHLVAFVNNLANPIGIAFDVLADYEKGRLDAVTLENV